MFSRFRALGPFLAIGFSFLAAACSTLQGGPGRLYTVDEELAQAQAELPGLKASYYGSPAASDVQKYFRNEYIARRMYIIDVEYSAYEAGLTSERQKFMFGSSVTNQALTTLGTLTVGSTAQALTASAGAVNATRGFYDSDLLVAKTLQIIEGNMRAKRDTVARTILARRVEATTTYPLAAALSDLEDYYRAGTMNTGLIIAAGDAANNAADAANDKAVVVNFNAVTDLGKLIRTFAAASAANRARVNAWLDANAQGMPLALFIRSGRGDLFQKMISDLSIQQQQPQP